MRKRLKFDFESEKTLPLIEILRQKDFHPFGAKNKIEAIGIAVTFGAEYFETKIILICVFSALLICVFSALFLK